MAEVSGAGPQWLLLLLVAVLPGFLVSGECNFDQCCCYSDGSNDTLRTTVETFGTPDNLPAYQYVGVIPKNNAADEMCFCTDVTRVTTKLTLKEAEYVTKGADAAQQTSLNTDVTNKLTAQIPTMTEGVASLKYTLLSITAMYDSHTDTQVVLDVEVLLRGRDAALKDAVSQGMALALAQNTLGTGATAATYSVAQCVQDPVAALDNGQRVWTTGRVASAEAIYTCDARYNLSSSNSEEKSTCSHTNLQWTALPTELKCVPDTAKCADDPPLAPPQSSSSWNNYSKADATVVAYTCLDGYSSLNNIKAVSMCRSGIWSAITTSFKCIQTGCLDTPPQVPTQGVLDWQQQRADKTVVNYSCNKGFQSNTDSYPKVTCTNMTWVGFPDNWECIDEKIKLDPSENDGLDQLNYIYVVTIPSVAGLIIMILLCMCCTRTDSPLFNICNARGPKHSGYGVA